jgi:hypothetical protein
MPGPFTKWRPAAVRLAAGAFVRIFCKVRPWGRWYFRDIGPLIEWREAVRTFKVSDELYEQLKSFIVDPFDDTPEIVIGRLIEIANKAKGRWSPLDAPDHGERPPATPQREPPREFQREPPRDMPRDFQREMPYEPVENEVIL